jgi:Tat protein translocase TatB subunit
MYLFILESIGTSELILIGLVALIFFGPRKLPDLARTLGKTMNEFRRSTNEFKQVWEKEVASEVNQIKDDADFSSISDKPNTVENSIEKNTIANNKQIAAPEIKEVSQEDFQGMLPKENPQTLEKLKKAEPEESLASKQNWL